MTFSYKNIGKQIVAVSGPTSVVDEKMCDPIIQATHVVTEIKIGFRAFLLFESLATNGTTKEEVGLKIEEAILAIPLVNLENQSSVPLNEFTKKLKFKYYGDAMVDPPPMTYENSIKVSVVLNITFKNSQLYTKVGVSLKQIW